MFIIIVRGYGVYKEKIPSPLELCFMEPVTVREIIAEVFNISDISDEDVMVLNEGKILSLDMPLNKSGELKITTPIFGG